MSLIYSEESSLDKQRKIEKFLILEQNKYLLENLSSSNKNLNFGLLNSDVKDVLIASKEVLGNLYSSLVRNLDNSNISPEAGR